MSNRFMRDIRPPLRVVAPLTFYITIGYAVFNICIGILLYSTIVSSSLRVAGILSLQSWGFIFLSMGALNIVGVKLDNWKFIKRLMLFGVMVKTVWLMELISEAIVGGSPALVFIWALLLYLQAATYVYFTPVKSNDK